MELMVLVVLLESRALWEKWVLSAAEVQQVTLAITVSKVLLVSLVLLAQLVVLALTVLLV